MVIAAEHVTAKPAHATVWLDSTCALISYGACSLARPRTCKAPGTEKEIKGSASTKLVPTTSQHELMMQACLHCARIDVGVVRGSASHSATGVHIKIGFKYVLGYIRP